MSLSKDSDKGFPWFEELNFAGWFIQMKAHLRQSGAHKVLSTERPKDTDAQGVPIRMNAQQRQDFQAELDEYNRLDNIAFSELMKACRLNPKTKNLCETGDYDTAYDLVQKLRKRFYSVDETAKSQQLLRYHSMKQNEDETGSDFVDREQKAFLGLRDMGVNIDDTMRLTKFIQQDTTNSKYRQLAQTIYTTPAMNLTKAQSLFEAYQPPTTTEVTTTVNALFCKRCKKQGHTVKRCPGRQNHKGGKKTTSEEEPRKRTRYPCSICDKKGHPTYKCPRKRDVQKCMKEMEKSKKYRWGEDEGEDDSNSHEDKP
jgi:hypothetical protein